MAGTWADHTALLATFPEERRDQRIHVGHCRWAAPDGWHVFENQLPHSRGFPKLMRGDRRYLGNAPDGFRRFAEEFFNLLGFGVDK